MQTRGQRGEDRLPVARRRCAEGIVEVAERVPDRDPAAGQERQLRRAFGEAFRRAQPRPCGNVPHRVQPGVNVERAEPLSAAVDVGDSQAQVAPDVFKGVPHRFTPLQ